MSVAMGICVGQSESLERTKGSTPMRLAIRMTQFTARKQLWGSGWIGKLATAAGGQTLPDLQGNSVGDSAS